MGSFEVNRNDGLGEVSSDVFWEGVFSGKELLEDSSVESDDIVVPAFEDVERSRNVVYIPDIHGDFVGLRRALLNFNLIDENLRWVGGDTKIVFLGDLIDRGGADRWVLDYLIELKKQVFDAGGEMVTLVGNHEMFVLNALYGNLSIDNTVKVLKNCFRRYCKDLMVSFGLSPDSYPFDFKNHILGSDEFSKYVDFWNGMVPFDLEEDVLAVHGGVNPIWVDKLVEGGVDNVNRNFRKCVENNKFWEWNFVPKARGGSVEYRNSSPVWMDHKAMYDLDNDDLKYMYAGLKSIRVNMVVCGHQPNYKVRNFSLTNSFGENKIRFVCIDTVISRGFEAGIRNGGLSISRKSEVGFMDSGSLEVEIGFDKMYDLDRDFYK